MPPGLLGIRDKLDAWVFRQNVREALEHANDPDRIGKLRDALRRLQRSAEDTLSSRENWREVFRIGGIGGGVGLFGGALVAFSAGPVVLIPLAGAAVVIWRTSLHTRHATREITLLRQIADVAAELTDW